MKVKIENLTIETEGKNDNVSISISSFGEVTECHENCTENRTNDETETMVKTIDSEPNPDPVMNLDNFTWDEINAIADSGDAPIRFGLGATKKVVLTSGEEALCRILGFYHDKDANGNLIPITWNMVGLMDDEFAMNDDWTNVGGWRESKMRNYLNATVFDMLPDDLKKVIKPAMKLTSKGNCSTEIDETKDSLWLLSEKEIFGRAIYSVDGEGRWYDYYRQEDESWGKKHKNGNGESNWMWERSPFSGYSDYFCGVHSSGTASHYIAHNSRGVSFGFCV